MKIKARLPDGRSFNITVPEGAYYPTQLMLTVPEMPVTTTQNPVQEQAAPVDLPSDSKIETLQSGTTMAEGVNPDDLTSCMACCCAICSFYCKFPDCCGCHWKGVICCIEGEALACKPGVQDGSLCMCCKNEVECIKPTTCIKMTEQFLCIDTRCAFPCDQDVPCLVTVCGLTCIHDCTCPCKFGDTLGEVDQEEEKGGAPVKSEEMER